MTKNLNIILLVIYESINKFVVHKNVITNLKIVHIVKN